MKSSNLLKHIHLSGDINRMCRIIDSTDDFSQPLHISVGNHDHPRVTNTESRIRLHMQPRPLPLSAKGVFAARISASTGSFARSIFVWVFLAFSASLLLRASTPVVNNSTISYVGSPITIQIVGSGFLPGRTAPKVSF